MALYLKDEKADRLAREIARLEHCTITDAVTRSLEERHRRLVDVREEKRRKIDALLAEIHALPILDPTPPDEMLYDENGLPK